MPETKIFDSVLCCTGRVGSQPDSKQTCSGWHLDINCWYQETGFLDAPDIVPMGATINAHEWHSNGVRYVVQVSYVHREGRYA